MRQSIKRTILVSGLVFGRVGMAQAVEFARRAPAFPERAYTCRLNGDDVRLGERRCLKTPQGSHVAECGIALNMSTWRESGGSCS